MINHIVLLLLIIILVIYVNVHYKNIDQFTSNSPPQNRENCRIEGLIEDANCVSSYAYKGWYIPYIFNTGIDNSDVSFPA
jgi:hypothetical protein